MKTLNKFITSILSASIEATGATSRIRSDYPDRYVVADVITIVYSVRYADRYINITNAYMDEVVCLLGDNLRSITELWFNDQQALLNTSFITDHTLLTSVPKNMPAVQTNKIYMITANQDTVTFDFQVLPPVPKVTTLSNEWAAEGELVTLYGDFLIDDAAIPLQISFPGVDVPHANMTFNGSSSVSFHIPEGAQPGFVTVKSLSGTGKSKFYYRDDRNILFDWDGSRGGFATGHGWRAGVVHHPGDDPWKALDGSYLYFGGATVESGIGATWAEDNFCFNYWPGTPESGYPALSSLPVFAEYIGTYDVGGLQLKSEVLIPSSNPWSSAAMQIMLTSDDEVTHSAASNAYYSNTAFPRAVWMPWAATGSYDTGDKWETVTIPLAQFNRTHANAECATAFSKKFLTGLTFFLWHGGLQGTTCNPVLAIDNIRIVPIG